MDLSQEKAREAKVTEENLPAMQEEEQGQVRDDATKVEVHHHLP